MTIPNSALACENVPFYFLHIPKTAGSTLNILLKEVFSDDEILPRSMWHQVLELSPEQVNRYKLFSGHFYSYFYRIVPKPLRYFTFLRDPIERALSHYGHVIRDKTHYLHNHAMALGSFSAYMRDEATQFTISNFQVRALAIDVNPFPIAAALTQEQIDSFELERILESINCDLKADELLEIAIENLKHFCFVGVTERFEDSMEMLCNTFGWTHHSSIEPANINANRITKQTISVEDLNFLKRLNAADIALYEFALKNFENKRLLMQNPIKFVSYAQNFEDVMLWRALKHIKNGFYVDVGANNPTSDSITKAFYDKGWCGINIEPLPSHHKELNLDRQRDINLHCAAGSKSGNLEVWETDVRGWATANTEVIEQHKADGHTGIYHTVSTVTLEDVFNSYAPADVHFLKIDVEGYELEVLLGANFNKCRPWIVIVESTKPNSSIETYNDWEFILLDNNYLYAYSDGLNRFYVASEKSELILALKYPPNPFDNYIRAHELSLLYNSKQAEAKAEQAEAKAEQAEAKAEQAEAKAEQAEAKAEQAEAMLNVIKNSRLWRFASPIYGIFNSKLFK
jgi:FkbM family methyltransferase